MTSRARFFLAGLPWLLAVAAGETSAEPGRISAALKAAVVSGMRYDPAIRERALAEAANAEAGGEVVQMKRFVYTDSKLEREIDAVVTQQQTIAKEKRFRPETGGQFWEGKVGSLPATLGFEPLRDVMSNDSKFNGDPEMFRWNIFQLKL